MASPSARFRRPLDDSMLIRLALMSGLVSTEEVEEFYRLERLPAGKPTSFEEFLGSKGGDMARLEIVRRAYVETSDFGLHVVRYCRSRGISEEALGRLERALGDCETQQLLMVREGETPPRIGEMLVERGLIRRSALGEIVRQQGMIGRIARYDEARRARRRWPVRLGLLGADGRVHRRRLAIYAAVVALGAAGAVSLSWPRSSKHPIFGDLRGPEARPEAQALHDANLLGHYDNLLRALKERRYADAEDYRGRLRGYFRDLEAAGVNLLGGKAVDLRRRYHRPARHRAKVITERLGAIRERFEELDAARIRATSDRDLSRMTLDQVEARALGREEAP